MINFKKTTVAIALASLLVGCGGGSSSSDKNSSGDGVDQILDGKNITAVDFSNAQQHFTIATSVGDIHPGTNNDGDVIVVGHMLQKTDGGTTIIQVVNDKTIMGVECNVTGRTGTGVEFFCTLHGDIGGDSNKTIEIEDGINYEVVQIVEYYKSDGIDTKEFFIADFPKL